jgi:hypothetical protein
MPVLDDWNQARHPLGGILLARPVEEHVLAWGGL